MLEQEIPRHQKHQDAPKSEGLDLVSLRADKEAGKHPKEAGKESSAQQTRTEESRGESKKSSPAQDSRQPSESNLSTKTEQKILDSLRKDQGHHLEGVFAELQNLQKHESGEMFKKDLVQINSDLQNAGILPGLQIVQDSSKKEGFSTIPQDGISNPAAPAPDKSVPQGKNSNDAPQVAPAPEQQSKPIPDTQESKETHRAASAPEHHAAAHSGGHQHARHLHGGGHHGGGHHGDGHHGGHHGGGHHRFAGGAYDNISKPDEATLAASIKTVLNEAKALGLSEAATRAAVASMLVESQGNPLARGDGNTSFGLFQLHRGGELTEALNQGKLKNENEAFDPVKNADVALTYFKQKQGYRDLGKLAAAAQRPRDRAEYADKVNSLLNDGTVDNLIKKYAA